MHKKGPVLVILVPGGIESSRSGSFVRKKSIRGHWGFWGCYDQWGCKKVSKARKITTGLFDLIIWWQILLLKKKACS